MQSIPGGAVTPPYGPAALLSWGMGVALSVAATAKTAWVISSDAITLFVDGSVAVDWDTSTRFATNEVVGRAETRVYPAVTKPASCVKVTLP
jgi:hypothetical protein